PAGIYTLSLHDALPIWRVADVETQVPLTGARIQVLTEDTTLVLGAAADVNGEFQIPQVPIGKHTLKTTFLGYEPSFQPIQVNSGDRKSTRLNSSHVKTS